MISWLVHGGTAVQQYSSMAVVRYGGVGPCGQQQQAGSVLGTNEVEMYTLLPFCLAAPKLDDTSTVGGDATASRGTKESDVLVSCKFARGHAAAQTSV